MCGMTSEPCSAHEADCDMPGVEYASIFATAGVQVTLIDRRERLLDFVDREIVPLLDRLASKSANKDLRAAALAALGRTGSQKSMETLLEQAHTQSPHRVALLAWEAEHLDADEVPSVLHPDRR